MQNFYHDDTLCPSAAYILHVYISNFTSKEIFMKTPITPFPVNSLTEEQFEFADANFGLVVKACNAYHVPEDLYEDCLQAGWETLLKKIPDFDGSRAKFSTFIFPWLRNAFNDVIKENGDGMTYKPKKTAVNVLSLEKPVGYDGEGNSCSLSDLLPSDRDAEREAVNEMMNDQLYRCLRRLDSRERFILTRYYNLGNGEDREWSLREIALALGTTRTTVSNVMARALEKLRAMLEYGAGMRHAA